MAEYNCSACEELREESTNFVVNGITDTECTSLKNDTGINPSAGHDDCTDLNNINDCLVGNMDDEVEAYDVCDWKTFMHKFIPNVWTTFKGIICAICGLWTNVHKIQCEVNYLFEGATFEFDEMSQTDTSYIVAGKGVSFANVSASGTASEVRMTYIGGAFCLLSGSCIFYKNDFTDAKSVYNYDDSGVNPTMSSSRKGNSIWGDSNTHVNGGELVYELRLKKSEFPQIGRAFAGLGMETSGGAFHIRVMVFEAGQYAFGQHGACDTTNGDPFGNSDRGHLVSDGYEYIQVRMTEIEALLGSNASAQFTPFTMLPIRINKSAIDC